MSLFSTCRLSSQREYRGIFIIPSVLLCVCVWLCMHMHTWMGVWYTEKGREACVYLCVFVFGVCASLKCFSLKKFQTLSGAFWIAEECGKTSFPAKIPATKKLWCIKCHSVEGIGSSNRHKYNLSSRSGASFWINSVCGMTVYEAGRHRAHVMEGRMRFTLREKRWHDQLHQQKACRRC